MIGELAQRWLERAKAFADLPQAEKDRLNAEADMRRQQQLEDDKAARLAAIPLRYRDATLTNSEVADWVEGFLKGESESLLLTGPTGVGKTHAMFGLYRSVVDADPYRAPRLEYHPVPLLLAKLRPSPPDGFVEYLRDCRLLILDDIGANKASDWTADILFQIIDDRYAWKRPTVFATNVPPKELKATLGDRLGSRLAEICKVVPFVGEDRRRA